LFTSPPNSNALAYLVRDLADAFDHFIGDTRVGFYTFGIGRHPPGLYLKFESRVFPRKLTRDLRWAWIRFSLRRLDFCTVGEFAGLDSGFKPNASSCLPHGDSKFLLFSYDIRGLNC
jgi:hypothetical protein